MATMIIEGERTKAASGKTYEVRNPATAEVVDEVPAGGPADVDRAAQAAHKAFGTWARLPANQRREILHKAAQPRLGKVEEIATILTKEQGKTILESRLEARRFGENIGWFADLADKVHGQHVKLPDTTTYGLVVRKPIGVCGAIVPWNFPLTLAANKVAPAIAAGNTHAAFDARLHRGSHGRRPAGGCHQRRARSGHRRGDRRASAHPEDR